MDRWNCAPLEELEDGESLGAELLDSSIEFVGDVGRDPMRGLEDPSGAWTAVND